MGSATGGHALGTRGRSSLGPSSSSPLSRARHWGGGSGHPLVPASTWALPAHGCARVCVHGCTQACGCAAERACACKRVCARASVRARRREWWGGCVALPVRDRCWRARCGQGEGMRRPTDHLVQRLPEPAGRWRAVHRGGAGTAVESRRQLVCCLQPPAAPGRLGGCRSSPATGEQPPASSAAPGRDPPWECAGQTPAAAGVCSALPPACCPSSASPGAVPQFPHLCCACRFLGWWMPWASTVLMVPHLPGGRCPAQRVAFAAGRGVPGEAPEAARGRAAICTILSGFEQGAGAENVDISQADVGDWPPARAVCSHRCSPPGDRRRQLRGECGGRSVFPKGDASPLSWGSRRWGADGIAAPPPASRTLGGCGDHQVPLGSTAHSHAPVTPGWPQGRDGDAACDRGPEQRGGRHERSRVEDAAAGSSK